MWHRNAKLTYLSRLDLVHQVEAGWSQSEVARQFRVSRPTVSKYVRR
ncbi:MAG: helix-turn-helix domain-containing protein [Chloroflexi bacterium]|nr:helix-turn-helix domain-containing protein [Chloroflexota bacterium]